VSALYAHVRYFVADAVDEWRHAPGPNVLATATIAAVLFVAGANLLVVANLSQNVARWRNDLRVSVYLVDGADPAAIETLRAGLAGLQGVARVDVVGKDEALKRFRESFPDLGDVPAQLGSNPLPASLEVILTPGPASRTAAAAIGASARASVAVEDVRYDQGFLDRIDALLGVARWGGGVFGAVVFTAVAFVVAGVLRLTVYTRRDEIDIMLLVGASPSFVRGPFLVAGLAQGLGGGILAVLAVEAARRTARTYAGAPPAALLDFLAGRPVPAGAALALVAIGGALGVVSAWFAVRGARLAIR